MTQRVRMIGMLCGNLRLAYAIDFGCEEVAFIFASHMYKLQASNIFSAVVK